MFGSGGAAAQRSGEPVMTGFVRSTALVLAGTMLSGAAMAQQAAPVAAAAPSPSPNPMVNLVRILVQQKTITQAAGDALIAQAEEQARAAAIANPQPPPAGTVRVPYVPSIVREQIRDEVKTEVLQAAKAEGWAQPGKLPGWLDKVTLSGDFRLRSESLFFGGGNAPDIIDVAQFNASGPINVGGTAVPGGTLPFLNTRNDRANILRLRARLGLTAEVLPGVVAGFRLGSGDSSTPVSTNQILGGGFGKKQIWLDRAYLQIAPVKWGSLTFGRMPSPFYTPTEMVFDEDVNFDGVAATLRNSDGLVNGLTAAVTGGFFPYEQGGFNFPTNSQTKSRRSSKYLYAVQGKIEYKASEQLSARAGVGYYRFENVQAQVPDFQCAIGTPSCANDQDRPAFSQKGNTYFYLRRNGPDLANPVNQTNPQFLGLALKYELLNVNADVTYKLKNEIGVTMTADYVRNLGFKRGDLCRYGPGFSPLTNVLGNGLLCAAPAVGEKDPARFVGGNEGYNVAVAIGYVKPRLWGQWRAFGGYRKLDSDATVDGLTDSDFHLGGTNAKGYYVGAVAGLLPDVRLQARYLSTNEVSGLKFAIDTLQIDLVAEF